MDNELNNLWKYVIVIFFITGTASASVGTYVKDIALVCMGCSLFAMSLILILVYYFSIEKKRLKQKHTLMEQELRAKEQELKEKYNG